MNFNKYYLVLFITIGVVLLSTVLVRNYLIEQDTKRQDFENDILQHINNTQTQIYKLIVSNQHLIINLSDAGNHASQKNLNLTKFNRASLVNTNEIVREIAKQLNITIP